MLIPSLANLGVTSIFPSTNVHPLENATIILSQATYHSDFRPYDTSFGVYTAGFVGHKPGPKAH